ncbi:glycosyltransferase family 69 protein, partial [Patellaria atrata CBS 101060]
KVIWLNDIVFTTQDILTLLSTNFGDYAAGCSLDFAKPPLYYDTFALRDIDGYKTATQTWPYFQSSTSRRALISNRAVPVQSCWNGMVVMNAQPFYAADPLKFRGIPDSFAELHLEGSECCLVHADNPLSASRGVWLNPNVRVDYNPKAYDIVNASPGEPWPSPRTRINGSWYNRWCRWTGAPRRILEGFVVTWRLRKWKSEAGANCLINEMQVLIENGWKHL